MIIVMIKITNVNMEVAAEKPAWKKVLKTKTKVLVRNRIAIKGYLRQMCPVEGALTPPARTMEKNRSQKRQRMGAATTWLTAPE